MGKRIHHTFHVAGLTAGAGRVLLLGMLQLLPQSQHGRLSRLPRLGQLQPGLAELGEGRGRGSGALPMQIYMCIHTNTYVLSHTHVHTHM